MGSLRSESHRQARLIWRSALLFALLAVAVLALCSHSASLQSGVLVMLPALAIAVLMLTRPYLGERLIASLRARRPRRSPMLAPMLSVLHPAQSVARGGRLIAVALAGRAPPLVLDGCH